MSTYVSAQLTKDKRFASYRCSPFYWLPKLHKNPYKYRFISNSSHCSTTILTKHITSALTTVKVHVIKYCENAFGNSNVNYFWSTKNSSEVIEKLRLRNFHGSQVQCNLQITSKLLTQGYRYHKLRKTFGKFFRSYSELLSKFGDISFQEYVFKGISHPVFYGDLVYKLRRVKDTPNFISSGSKIVKRLRRRQYDPLIIETTIGLVLGPCTALCRLFLKHCTLTNKAVGTI